MKNLILIFLSIFSFSAQADILRYHCKLMGVEGVLVEVDIDTTEGILYYVGDGVHHFDEVASNDEDTVFRLQGTYIGGSAIIDNTFIAKTNQLFSENPPEVFNMIYNTTLEVIYLPGEYQTSSQAGQCMVYEGSNPVEVGTN